MRLAGSKTSILSARSMATGDASGKISENDRLGTVGSRFTYFLALSLLRNPRSESSGEPNSCNSTNKYIQNNRRISCTN